MPFSPFSALTSKLFGGLSLGLMIAMGLMYLTIKHLNHEIDNLHTWQGDMVVAVKNASGNDKTTTANAKEQVYEMGKSITIMIGATKTQNDAIDALNTQRDAALAKAEAERADRAVAIAKAEDLAKQLRDSELKPVPKADVEKEVRRVQDLVYGAGL